MNEPEHVTFTILLKYNVLYLPSILTSGTTDPFGVCKKIVHDLKLRISGLDSRLDLLLEFFNKSVKETIKKAWSRCYPDVKGKDQSFPQESLHS